MENYDLIDNIFTERKIEDVVKELFSENGRVFIIAGYFSLSGYQLMKEAIEDFLFRKKDNEIFIIVGTEPNQFSATVAHDLWELDKERKQINLLKYDDSFVHTKHYVRESKNPAVILGSANFTLEGFEKHLELVSYYEGESSDDQIAEHHIGWFKSLVNKCEVVTEEDLEHYEDIKIDIGIEEFELLTELGISIEDIKNKLKEPDSFPTYKLNLLSRYLELEDTTKATLAVKSEIKKYPHQVIAGSKAYKNLSYNNFYLLADEVGLGKTFEAGLAYKQLRYSGKVKRTLIICRSSAMKDWENAFNKFFVDPTLITSSKKSEWKKKGLSEKDIWLKDEVMICTH
ncbi:MAG: restriction endonuclease PLD domain-containing protein, partial [archaeon]